MPRMGVLFECIWSFSITVLSGMRRILPIWRRCCSRATVISSMRRRRSCWYSSRLWVLWILWVVWNTNTASPARYYSETESFKSAIELMPVCNQIIAFGVHTFPTEKTPKSWGILHRKVLPTRDSRSEAIPRREKRIDRLVSQNSVSWFSKSILHMYCCRESNTDLAVSGTDILGTNARMETAKVPAHLKTGSAMMVHAVQLKKYSL